MGKEKQIVKRELRALDRRALKVETRIEHALWEDFGRKYYSVTQLDRWRLTTLWVWSQRYKVTIRYILKVLLPYYDQLWKKKAKARSLGVKVATLCGKHSEEILKERIQKDFPEKENERDWLWSRRRRILQTRELDEVDFDPRVRGLLDFKSVKKFVSSYRTRVQDERAEFDAKCSDEENKRRKYRGNPFS